MPMAECRMDLVKRVPHPARRCQTTGVFELDAAGVVRRHVEAFNSRDLDSLMAGFTNDTVWVTGTTVVRGAPS